MSSSSPLVLEVRVRICVSTGVIKNMTHPLWVRLWGNCISTARKSGNYKTDISDKGVAYFREMTSLPSEVNIYFIEGKKIIQTQYKKFNLKS